MKPGLLKDVEQKVQRRLVDLYEEDVTRPQWTASDSPAGMAKRVLLVPDRLQSLSFCAFFATPFSYHLAYPPPSRCQPSLWPGALLLGDSAQSHVTTPA
jgi:hypothetical protein